MENSATTIGTKLKDIRQMKELSVEEVADRADIDLDFYKLLEDNKEIPSIGDLIRITRVLGVRLGTILDDQQDNGPIITRKSEVLSSQAFRSRNANAGDSIYHSLCQKKANRHMDCFRLEVKPPEGEKIFSTHEGEEFLLVDKGEAVFSYGKQTFNLKEGDTVYYDSIVPHNISSASESESAFLIAVIYIPS